MTVEQLNIVLTALPTLGDPKVGTAASECPFWHALRPSTSSSGCYAHPGQTLELGCCFGMPSLACTKVHDLVIIAPPTHTCREVTTLSSQWSGTHIMERVNCGMYCSGRMTGLYLPVSHSGKARPSYAQ